MINWSQIIIIMRTNYTVHKLLRVPRWPPNKTYSYNPLRKNILNYLGWYENAYWHKAHYPAIQADTKWMAARHVELQSKVPTDSELSRQRWESIKLMKMTIINLTTRRKEEAFWYKVKCVLRFFPPHSILMHRKRHAVLCI